MHWTTHNPLPPSFQTSPQATEVGSVDVQVFPHVSITQEPEQPELEVTCTDSVAVRFTWENGYAAGLARTGTGRSVNPLSRLGRDVLGGGRVL